MISARELLPLLPAEIASVLRLGGGRSSGLVLVLRFDGDVLARLELQRPLDFGDWLASSVARGYALGRLRGRRGRGGALVDVSLYGAKPNASRVLRRGEIRAALSHTAEELDLPLAEVSHRDDDGSRSPTGTIWVFLPDGGDR